MIRIIDGQLFEGKPSEDRFHVTIHDFGNGQREACIQRATDWEHVGPLDPNSINAQVLRGEREDPDAEEKRLANLKRTGRRRKSKVRRLCKAFGLDRMLTLTYRENQRDLALAKVHVKAFVRKLKPLLPGFRYVACYERQERGAWHVHVAVRAIPVRLVVRGVRLKSFDALRSLWRSVVGIDNGNIDISDGQKKGRKKAKRRSPARLAAYMAKYMTKNPDTAEHDAELYSASSAAELPQSQRIEYLRTSLAELVPMVYSKVALAGTELFTWLSRWGDVFYIASEPQAEHELAPWEI